jgi:hypothetical protein
LGQPNAQFALQATNNVFGFNRGTAHDEFLDLFDLALLRLIAFCFGNFPKHFEYFGDGQRGLGGGSKKSTEGLLFALATSRHGAQITGRFVLLFDHGYGRAGRGRDGFDE